MRATILRWGRGLAALVALFALTACTLGREPAYDAALAGEITDLTAGTLRLFQDFTPITTGDTGTAGISGGAGTYADREPQYRTLSARAETVRLMAQARGSAAAAPTSGLLLRVAQIGADTSLAEDISPKAMERLAEYQDATPAYMTDYLRNLALLEAHDRTATGDQVAKETAYRTALAEHQRATEVYLAAFRQWQAGRGPQPAPPAAPPRAPVFGLDPTQVALRITALEDILRDALVYERDILNRNR